MGLFKRKNSECWHMCFFLEGRKVRKSTGSSNKRAALKIYDTARFRIAQGTYDEKIRRDMTFIELVEQFLEKHSLVEKASYKRDKVIGTAVKAYFGKRAIGGITLQNILGHKSLSMTQRYAHLIPERFEKSRQIMQDFWQGGTPLGDTKVTQLVDENVQRAVNHRFY